MHDNAYNNAIYTHIKWLYLYIMRNMLDILIETQ